ncbi:50S ribosomal protein L4 [Candidatus Aerophobetes bacterium]|nr:50S ribosomal protein L4 [Candidatus Aerophobetes bacterium]
MEWNIYNMQGEKVGNLRLDDTLFAGEVNEPVLREAYLAYQTNQRQGTVSTKTKAEVSGGGRKPYPQKGTGRARAGSIRSPLWVGGGITFGPKPRSFEYMLSKKKKKGALISALRVKVKEGRLFLLDNLTVESGKTKEIASFLKSFSRITSIDGKNLAIVTQPDEKLRRASSNIPNLRLVLANNVCAYHVLCHDNIFFTQDSLQGVVKRLKNE